MHPKIINDISCAKTTDKILDTYELEILKRKLLDAEHNKNLICLARGEGRAEIIDSIVSNDDILFNWGSKCMNGFHDKSLYRDFLSGENIDVRYFNKLIDKCEDALEYNYSKHFQNSELHIETTKKLIKTLKHLFESGLSVEDLNITRDYLACILHTSGNINFKNISPWISTSMGENRFNTAYNFAKGTQNSRNKKFVIFDTWVDKRDEFIRFYKTDYLIRKLNELGLPWYDDTHSEIMLKYAIYPQDLIGYYYFNETGLQYYYVNPHYWNEIKRNPEFSIGNYVYIDQTDVKFPADNPYKVIYSFFPDDNTYSIFDKR